VLLPVERQIGLLELPLIEHVAEDLLANVLLLKDGLGHVLVEPDYDEQPDQVGYRMVETQNVFLPR
jgi:hypothetical protein